MDSRVAAISVDETQPATYLHQSHVLAIEHPKLLRHVLEIPALIGRAVAGSEKNNQQFAHAAGSPQERKN